RLVAEVRAQRLPRLELGPVGLDLALEAARASTSFGDHPQRPAEDATPQWAPGDDTHAVVDAGRQDLELDGAGVQVVQALFRDQPQRTPPGRGFVGLDDVPAREVAAPHVDHLALGNQQLHGLPDLVPGGITVDVVHL